MRTSAGSIKRTQVGSPLQEKPREGTKLRALYDLAITGRWFSLEEIGAKAAGNMLKNLSLFYELEIVARRRAKKSSLYRCSGIWNGTELHTIADVEQAIEHTLKGN